MKKISFIIYKILKLFDSFFKNFFNKSFLIFFNEFFNNDLYIKKKINEKKMIFFTPNSIIKWRVDTILSKEPETIEWIDSFKSDSKEKIIFWDIGANIGLYSLYAASKHKNIQVFSFEPSSSNLRVLSRNISINNFYDKIIINQFPLSSEKFGYAYMNEPNFTEGWAMNSFGLPLDYRGDKFDVEQKYKMLGLSIDFILGNKFLEVPNYIKIDVDGIEDKILEGGINSLNHVNLKSVSIELNENYTSQYNNVFNSMKKIGLDYKQKKHANIYDDDQRFSNLYNYLFEKK